MQKFLFIFLCLVVAWITYQGRFGRGGKSDDLQISAQINGQTKLNHDLSERNNQMIMKIAGLKGSSDSIEQRSREELNMIKSGETLVMLPGNDLEVEKKAVDKK